MDKRLWHTIQANYVVKQKLSYLPRTKKAPTHVTRDQLHQLGQSVHNGEDTIEALGGRQISDEVQTVAGKSTLRNGQRLQQTSR